MTMDREQVWQAYIDGELSACEAAQFETTLTDVERARLVQEMRFDQALAERLREGAACPDEAWARAVAPLRSTHRRAPLRRRIALAGAALAAAALAVFALPALYPDGVAGVLYRDVIYADSSLEELQQESEVAPGQESVIAYLAAKDVPLDIAAESEMESRLALHRPIQILGARQTRMAGATITEVLINCCGKPVRLVFAPSGSRAARMLDGGIGHTQAAEHIGAYTVATVARHPVIGLLGMVTTADAV